MFSTREREGQASAVADQPPPAFRYTIQQRYDSSQGGREALEPGLEGCRFGGVIQERLHRIVTRQPLTAISTARP